MKLSLCTYSISIYITTETEYECYWYFNFEVVSSNIYIYIYIILKIVYDYKKRRKFEDRCYCSVCGIVLLQHGQTPLPEIETRTVLFFPAKRKRPGVGDAINRR